MIVWKPLLLVLLSSYLAAPSAADVGHPQLKEDETCPGTGEVPTQKCSKTNKYCSGGKRCTLFEREDEDNARFCCSSPGTLNANGNGDDGEEDDQNSEVDGKSDKEQKYKAKWGKAKAKKGALKEKKKALKARKGEMDSAEYRRKKDKLKAKKQKQKAKKQKYKAKTKKAKEKRKAQSG